MIKRCSECDAITTNGEELDLDAIKGSELIEIYWQVKEELDLKKEFFENIKDAIASRKQFEGPEEGSVTKTLGSEKITVTRKLTRKIEDNYIEYVDIFPEALNPVKMKPSLDLKVLRSIETANPKLAALAAKFITVKPAKTAVKIEKVKEGK